MGPLTTTPPCRACGGDLHGQKLDLGRQPLCNRFLTDATADEYTYPMVAGVCQACALVQLLNPAPAAELTPRFDWIRYSEPEGHLDDLTKRLIAAGWVGEGSVVGGVSYKDDTLLTRLAERAGASTWRIGSDELNCDAPRAEVETVQLRLTPSTASEIVARHGAADLLVARHVLEHAHDLGTFLNALQLLVKPSGRIVIEAPDCTAVLALSDYSTLWEEHVLYFTPATLHGCLIRHGLEVEKLYEYPYPLENSLVAIVTKKKSTCPPDVLSPEELGRALSYLSGFAGRQQRYHSWLSSQREQGPLALLGSGHLACMFVNLMRLGSFFDFVADDDPNRKGLFMPGSRLPIIDSTALAERGIRLCLLGLNPLNEGRVVARHAAWLESGGRFLSIFPASHLALKV